LSTNISNNTHFKVCQQILVTFPPLAPSSGAGEHISVNREICSLINGGQSKI